MFIMTVTKKNIEVFYSLFYHDSHLSGSRTSCYFDVEYDNKL